jgi:hypothetical protein
VLYLSGAVRPDLPAMLTPRMGQRPPEGQLWAADNGRFASPKDYTDLGYLFWLRELDEWQDRCLFATAPDVYGDHAATLELSLPMLPRIRALGYPGAFVIQPGATSDTVPWDEFDALFVGGPWRGTEPTFTLAAEAKERGKWVHMGRVNSRRMFLAAQSGGFDSADGTFLRYGPDRRRPEVDAWLEASRRTLWSRA